MTRLESSQTKSAEVALTNLDVVTRNKSPRQSLKVMLFAREIS